MNQDNNWINDFWGGQLAAIKFENNWLDGYATCSKSNEAVYNRDIDKDEKIRNLEARVKELEAILEEEI